MERLIDVKGRYIMPNNQTQRITHGAMAIALFAILIAIAYYVPIIGIVTLFFAPLSIAWFSAKYDRSISLFVGIIACIVTFLIGFGDIFALFLAIIFAVCGVVMGDAIRLGKSKTYLYISTSIAVLLTFALYYVISLKILEIDFIKDSFELMRQSYEESYELTKQLTGQSPFPKELLDVFLEAAEMSIPASITLGAFFFAFLLISINFPLLKRLNIRVPKFGAFKELRLPRTVLWIYFIILIIYLFVRPEFGSTLYVITLNFAMVLWVLLTIQGIAFLHFVLEAYKSPRFLIVLTTIMAIPLSNYVILIGILDLGFDIRSYVTRKIQK